MITFKVICLFLFISLSYGASPPPTGNHSGDAQSLNFDIRGYPLSLAVCATILFLVSAFFELITAKLDEFVSNREHFKHLLDAVYKELTVLGLLAFFIFIFKVFTVLDDISNGLADVLHETDGTHTLEVFEWLHVLLFTFAMFIVLVASYLVFVQIRTTRRWNVYELLTFEGSYNNLIHSNQNLDNSRGIYWIINRIRLSTFRNQYQFICLKEGVLKRYGLSVDFPFASYLKYCLHETTIDLLRFSPLVPLMMIVSYWIFSGLFLLFESQGIQSYSKNSVGESIILMISGLILLFISLIIWGKCSFVADNIARAEREAMKTNNIIVTPISHLDRESLRKETKDHKKGFRRNAPKETVGAKLYWFGNPNLIITLLQLLIWWSAIYAGSALYACIMGEKAWYWWIIYFSTVAINLFVIIPFLLGAFVKGTFTGDMVCHRLLLKAVSKQVSKRNTLDDHEIKNVINPAINLLKETKLIELENLSKLENLRDNNETSEVMSDSYEDVPYQSF